MREEQCSFHFRILSPTSYIYTIPCYFHVTDSVAWLERLLWVRIMEDEESGSRERVCGGMREWPLQRGSRREEWVAFQERVCGGRGELLSREGVWREGRVASQEKVCGKRGELLLKRGSGGRREDSWSIAAGIQRG
jgi:hypothetical protein